jgi:hypothetical protein
MIKFRRNLNPAPKAADQKPGAVELYDLTADPRETTDVAKDPPGRGRPVEAGHG